MYYTTCFSGRINGMNKKEFAVVVIVLLFAGLAGGWTIFMPGNKEPNKSDSAAHGGHDETNSDGHHSSETASSSTPENAEDLTKQTEVKLDIKDFAYSKRDIKVKKGTKVTWTNLDSMEHNVMREHDDSGHAHDAPKASEVKADVFSGPLLKKGESYSFTFNEVGLNPYHCAPHPYMQGSVTVVE
jgi:amicyanin